MGTGATMHPTPPTPTTLITYWAVPTDNQSSTGPHRVWLGFLAPSP